VCAEDEKLECGQEYLDMLDGLPDEVADLLPEKLFSNNVEDITEGAKEALDFNYIVGAIASQLGLKLKSILKMSALILGVLILSSVLNSAKSSFSSEGVSRAFSTLSACALFLSAIGYQLSIIQSVSDFFRRICLFTNTLVPLMGVLYAMGGNVATAVVNHSSLVIFMSIVENFCSKSAIAITGICIAFASVSAIMSEISIGSISAFFKKTYTQGLGFFMSIFVTVMGAQSLIAGRADTLAGKAAKFAVGNLIPTVGSALAGTLGTVGGSVEYIRASIGTVGIVAIILMLAPTLITLILAKFAFGLLEGAADILGCSTEKKVISELSSINGFLLAVSAICSVCLIFIMAMFAKCSAAAGGGGI
jgi:stage III sporulation protein AE